MINDSIASILNAMYTMNADKKEGVVDMDFKKVYEKQGENQRDMLKFGMYDKSHCSESTYKTMYNVELPIDDVRLASYHIQQLMSEVGELLDADKRWKNFRNEKYDKDAKLDELVDCYIELFNISMFSGFSAEDVYNAILKKLGVIKSRIDKEAKKQTCNCGHGKEKYKPEGVCNCGKELWHGEKGILGVDCLIINGQRVEVPDGVPIADFLFGIYR